MSNLPALPKPSVHAYAAVSGAAAVKVLGAAGQRQSGIPVAISGPASRSQNTSSDGCAFFAYIPSGVYTAVVTLVATQAGY